MPSWIPTMLKLLLLVGEAVTLLIGFLVVMFKLLTAAIDLVKKDEEKNGEQEGVQPSPTRRGTAEKGFVARLVRALANGLHNLASLLSGKTYVEVPQEGDESEQNEA